MAGDLVLKIYSAKTGAALGSMSFSGKGETAKVEAQTVDGIGEKFKSEAYSINSFIEHFNKEKKVGVTAHNPRAKFAPGNSSSKYSEMGDSSFEDYVRFRLLDSNIYSVKQNFTGDLVYGLKFTTTREDHRNQSWDSCGGLFVWKDSAGKYTLDQILPPSASLFSSARSEIQSLVEEIQKPQSQDESESGPGAYRKGVSARVQDKDFSTKLPSEWNNKFATPRDFSIEVISY